MPASTSRRPQPRHPRNNPVLLLLSLALSALVPLAAAASDQPPPGLSLAPCNATAPCAAPRRCVDARTLSLVDPAQPCPANATSTPCVCVQPELRSCADSTACAPGERCARAPPPLDDGVALCAACDLALLTPVDASCAQPLPFLSGFAGDPCSVAKPCQQPFECTRPAGDPDKPVPTNAPQSACQSGDNDCACSNNPAGDVFCFASSACAAGERCIRLSGAQINVCRGCSIAQADRLTTLDAGRCLSSVTGPTPSASPDDDGDHAARPMSTPRPTRYAGGNSFDPCTPAAPCRDGLQCIAADLSEGTFSPCASETQTCSCAGALRQCSGSAACPRGERCVATGNNPSRSCQGCVFASRLSDAVFPDGDDNCVKLEPSPVPTRPPAPPPVDSNSAEPSPDDDDDDDDDDGNDAGSGNGSSTSSQTPPTDTQSSPVPSSLPSATDTPAQPTDPPICVAASHLEALPRSQLVFRTHRSAWVLCDGHGSCATAGHMVVLRGTAMRMRTYCARLAVAGAPTCVRRRVAVNSPRFRPGLRVASRTPALHFSALAARWDTDAEERVLAALVHHLGA